MIIIISHPQEERALSLAYAVWAFGGLGRCWHGLCWAVQTREEDHRSSALLLRNQIPSDKSNTVRLFFPQLQIGNQHLGSSLQPFSLGGAAGFQEPQGCPQFSVFSYSLLQWQEAPGPLWKAWGPARDVYVLRGGDRCGQRG